MLDQNTDRMWYVIGAVIVGAAIIFLANGSLPNLFASVTESFDESASRAIVDIESMHNLIDYDYHTIYRDRRINSETGDIVPNDYPEWMGNTITRATWYSMVGNIAVSPHTTYHLSAPNGLASPIVAYYAADGRYLGYGYKGGEPIDSFTFTTPGGTAYVLVGGGDTVLRPERVVDSMDNWVLERAYGSRGE